MSDQIDEPEVETEHRVHIVCAYNGTREQFTITSPDRMELMPYFVNDVYERYGSDEEYVEVRSEAIITRTYDSYPIAIEHQPTAEELAEMGLPREERGSPHNAEEAEEV